MTYSTESETQTQALGAQLVKSWQQKLVSKCVLVLLDGDLGAGKTQLVKGLAKGLGVVYNIVSPTFVYIRNYPIPTGELVHVDAWRMETEAEFASLHIEKYLKVGNLVVVEWARNLLNPMLNAGGAEIIKVIIVDTGEESRQITIS